jgi:hypothetical protein
MMVMTILLMMQPRMITKAQSSNQEEQAKRKRRASKKLSVALKWKGILVLFSSAVHVSFQLKLVHTSCNAIKVMLIFTSVLPGTFMKHSENTHSDTLNQSQANRKPIAIASQQPGITVTGAP